MERRVLLAIFLAFLVLYVWQAVFVKPVPKPKNAASLPLKPVAEERAFLRKSGLEADASLQEVVNALDEFLMPVVEGILRKRTSPSLWRPGGPWKASPPD